MEKLNRHVSELSTMLIAKGYDGQFLICNNIAGKLPDSLMEYSNSIRALNELENATLTMATHSDWKDGLSDYNFCFFKVDFSEQHGFRVREIEVERTNIYGDRWAKVTLPIKDTKDIPSRMQANEMVNPPMKSKEKTRKSLRR